MPSWVLEQIKGVEPSHPLLFVQSHEPQDSQTHKNTRRQALDYNIFTKYRGCSRNAFGALFGFVCFFACFYENLESVIPSKDNDSHLTRVTYELKKVRGAWSAQLLDTMLRHRPDGARRSSWSTQSEAGLEPFRTPHPPEE